MPTKSDLFPLIEIVIPTKNSEKTLKECLESLSNQTYPRDNFRVKIIDDSKDGTPTVVSTFKNALNIEIINASLGPSDKRNLGVNLSSAEYIAFIDSDCVADRNWLLKAVECFKDESVGAVGGPNLSPLNDGLMENCSGYILESFFGTGPLGQSRYIRKGKIREVQTNDLILCNVIVRKDVYQKVGGLDSTLFPGEEINLFSKFSDLGFKLLYSPDVVVYHKRRPLFSQHLKQIFGYGKGRGQAIRQREDAFNYYLLIPIIFTLSALTIPFLILFQGFFRYLVMAGVILYLIIDVLFSIQISMAVQDLRVFFILVVSFFLHHFMYGIGLLFGLFCKRIPKIEQQTSGDHD